MSKIADALAIAIERHKDQKRKLSHAPYIVHILDVAKFLMYADAPEYLIVAGILHDLLEDTYSSEQELEDKFGVKVLDLVRFCTEPDNKPDSTDEHMLKTWKARKEHAVEIAKEASDEELLLKLADTLANLTSLTEDNFLLGENIWDSFRGGKEGNTWYFRSLEKIFKERFPDNRLYKLYEKAIQEIFPK